MSTRKRQGARHTESVQPHQTEPIKTLWMLACQADEESPHQLVPFYALCEEDAEQQVQQWLSRQPHCMKRLSLRRFPAGFVICRQRLRGTRR